MSYAECLKKYYNAVDGTFYDAIKFKIKLQYSNMDQHCQHWNCL
jgi:hypothetical protein